MKFSSRRSWLRIGIALVVAFVAIQFVPYGHDRANPPVGVEPPWDTPATRALAKQACFDCHSNETEWPAYSRVAPVSWLIQHDVSEGRAELNLSDWPGAPQEPGETIEPLVEREMPPAIYQLMHAQARLSDIDRDRLARGLAATLSRQTAHARSDR